MLDVIAVDWSGRAARESESIWTAVAREGRLVALENGLDRAATVAAVIDAVGDGPAVVGLDFAFSFPRWYLDRRGWATAREAWAAMRDEGEALLAACAPPFWGRPGTVAQTLGPPLRPTEAAAPGAKSVFQIGGAGAVGTGSIRGMPHLLTLAEAGFAIWPFDDPGPRTVVEIYPRALTGPVNKTRHLARRALLERFPEQDPVLRERAAGSEDAFDAAVSAIVMARHLRAPGDLPAAGDGDVRREGAIWVPTVAPDAATRQT